MLMLKHFLLQSRAAPLVLTLAAMALIGASPSYALDPGGLESLIDFDDMAGKILPLIQTAVAAAASVGVVVLAAMACWNFFKRFISG